jgi:glutathione peroxidase
MANLTTLPLTTITGAPATLADYTSRVVLIVNVASKCGLTPQYTALESLYQRFQAQGLTIAGFPANDFAGQEPGSNDEIATFCSTTYPVTFPLFAKIAVTGPEQHPLYAGLTAALPEPIGEGPWREGLTKYSAAHGFPPPTPLPGVLWNFEKFLIGRDGAPVARFSPDVTPDDSRLIAAIEAALAA